MERIPIAQPTLGGNERKYVLECLDTNWISSNGRFIGAFEERFADWCGVSHAIATNNGTTALHVAMVALGLKPDDEVIVPTVTYVASANSVRYCMARPVLVDVRPGDLTIDTEQIEANITERTRGVLPVHLYGHPAKMDRIGEIADKHNLWVVEDAAEALGAEVNGRRVGGWGSAATFSFFGNKIITTGEGGMVTTNDPELAATLRLFRGQGMDPARRYWFPVVGYNYRMTNIQAAIGLAQLENIEHALEQRDQLAEWYAEALGPLNDRIQLPESEPWARQVCWLYTVFLRRGGASERDRVMGLLDEEGIETRPVFYPMHAMPPYAEATPYPVADGWSQRGINLPTHLALTRHDIARIAMAIDRSTRAS
jgi:perosamine synthetase